MKNYEEINIYTRGCKKYLTSQTLKSNKFHLYRLAAFRKNI